MFDQLAFKNEKTNWQISWFVVFFPQAREQEHKHQVRVMEINAEQESLAARRAMEESTRHARDAARDAQQALHEVSSHVFFFMCHCYCSSKTNHKLKNSTKLLFFGTASSILGVLVVSATGFESQRQPH